MSPEGIGILICIKDVPVNNENKFKISSICFEHELFKVLPGYFLQICYKIFEKFDYTLNYKQ